MTITEQLIILASAFCLPQAAWVVWTLWLRESCHGHFFREVFNREAGTRPLQNWTRMAVACAIFAPGLLISLIVIYRLHHS